MFTCGTLTFFFEIAMSIVKTYTPKSNSWLRPCRLVVKSSQSESKSKSKSSRHKSKSKSSRHKSKSKSKSLTFESKSKSKSGIQCPIATSVFGNFKKFSIVILI